MKDDFLVMPKEDELKALRKKLNQDEEKIEHILGLLLNWLSYQKHLPQNYNSNFLKNILIACKNDLERAKRKYICYSYTRIFQKEFLCDRILTPEGDFKCLEYIHSLVLPIITPDWCRICLLKVNSMDTFELPQVVRYFTIMLDYMAYNDTILAGKILIFDVGVIKPTHYYKIFTTLLLKCLRIGVDVYPVKIYKIILISLHPYLEKGINFCKSVLPQKVANRIMTVKDSSELLKLIPATCLPSDYGGSLKSIKELCDHWCKCLIESEEFLKQVNDDIPTGPIPNTFTSYETEYGIDGSFRKLNID